MIHISLPFFSSASAEGRHRSGGLMFIALWSWDLGLAFPLLIQHTCRLNDPSSPRMAILVGDLCG
jgi:hypothetical protein